MPSITDTQTHAQQLATRNLIKKITHYTTLHKLEKVMQHQILDNLNLGPLETLDPQQLRIVLNLLPIAHLWSTPP